MQKKSRALKKFRTRKAEILRLLKLCTRPSAKLSTSVRNTLRDRSLCRGATVLLCSHIEGYFENLVEDVLDFFENKKVKISNLPDRLITMHLWRYVENINDGNDGKKLSSIIKIANNPLSDPNAVCISGIFDYDYHVEAFDNPGSRAVKKLFYSIGITDIWDEIKKKKGNLYLYSRLNTLVDIRNAIAHGDIDSQLLRSNVEDYVIEMEQMIFLFDEIVREYLVINFNSKNPWIALR